MATNQVEWWKRVSMNVATGVLILVISSSFALAVTLQVQVAGLSEKIPEAFPPEGFATDVKAEFDKVGVVLADVRIAQGKMQTAIAQLQRNLEKHEKRHNE